MNKERLIPLIVATALFMENMDATVIATSLPAIAAAIGTSPLTLKLAITSYLLSLAVFIPASGWTADRFGARMVFSIAIAVFMVGSVGCALSSSVTDFVIARILQGVGGAMMTPVGRLVLLRSIDKSALVNAMAWVTVPALVGPVIGPPLGGFITTYFSWHWIFLINIPIGLVGIVMAMRFIDPIRSEAPERFDLYGLVLAGIGLAGIAFGLSVAGLNLLPWSVVAALVAIGASDGLARTVASALAVAAVLLVGFYLAQRRAGQRLLQWIMNTLTGDRQWRVLGTIDAVYEQLATIYADQRCLFLSSVVHMIGWLAGVAEVLIVFAWMGHPVGLGEAIVIESLLHAVRGAAFAIPSALGAQEGGLVLLCALFGIPPEQAIALSLVKRVPDVALGVPSLLAWQIMEWQRLQSNDATKP